MPAWVLRCTDVMFHQCHTWLLSSWGQTLLWIQPMTLSPGTHVSRDDERNGPEKITKGIPMQNWEASEDSCWSKVAVSRNYGCKDFSWKEQASLILRAAFYLNIMSCFLNAGVFCMLSNLVFLISQETCTTVSILEVQNPNLGDVNNLLKLLTAM